MSEIAMIVTAITNGIFNLLVFVFGVIALFGLFIKLLRSLESNKD